MSEVKYSHSGKPDGLTFMITEGNTMLTAGDVIQRLSDYAALKAERDAMRDALADWWSAHQDYNTPTEESTYSISEKCYNESKGPTDEAH